MKAIKGTARAGGLRNRTEYTMDQTMTTRNEAGEGRRVQYVQPRTSVLERSDAFVVELEMPGVAKSGLTVHVEANELVVAGERTPVTMPGEVVHREIRAVNYKRVFELDPAIDVSRIQARLDQGVVTVTLPKMERVQPRRIEVMD